jgi:hypothetical protein
MPIRPRLEGGAFTPDEVANLVAAFEGCLRSLKMMDRSHPTALLVAQRVVEIAKTGLRHPLLLQNAVLRSLKSDAGTTGC